MVINSKGLVKYRNIIVGVVLFLVFDAAILLVNYYMSIQIAQGTTEVNISAQQSVLTQEMAKDIMNIDLLTDVAGTDTGGAIVSKALLESDVIQDALSRIEKSQQKFDATLIAFMQGKSVEDERSQPITINQVSGSYGIKTLENIESVWLPYKRLIGSFLAAAKQGKIDKKSIAYTVDYIRVFNDSLYYETSDLTKVLESLTQKKAKNVQYIQLLGIFIAILLFLYIILLALRQLLKTDGELEEARSETTQIMATINEGLFLLDEELVIGGQYSAELESILGTKNIANRRLESLLESIISSKDLEVTKEFINQLFNERVKARLISDLNPLERVKVLIKGKDGHTNTHYLRFNFSRVYEGKAITRVLTSVADITNEVNLERRLELERSHNDEQIEMLTMILRIDQRSLASFVRNAQSILSRINSILERPGRRESDLRSKAKMIAREAHGLKGEASALDLSSIVTTVEELEDQVGKLNHKSGISGDDFLPPAVLLEKLMATIEKIDELHKRIGGVDLSMPDISSQGANHSNSSLGDIRNAETNFNDYFTRFVSQIANRNHKEVSVDIEGFDDNLPEDKLDAIKEVTIQLIRNSVVHGIEIPESRESLGKNRQGLIKVHLQSQKDKLQLSVEDDGQGIDFNAIKHKAVARKEGGEQTPLSNQDLLRYMFSPGFSTAATKNEDAGRGVGMDLIKARVQSLQGRISVGTKKNEFTRFTISFPK